MENCNGLEMPEVGVNEDDMNIVGDDREVSGFCQKHDFDSRVSFRSAYKNNRVDFSNPGYNTFYNPSAHMLSKETKRRIESSVGTVVVKNDDISKK